MRLPLEGIRILDNGIVQAGTFPSRLLADFGAEVVRVENYAKPDVSRNVVFADGAPGDPYWEAGGTYHEQHRNKAFCIGLDVRKPEGREAFLRLVQASDIVMDSHPPGVMDRLNLGYEALKAEKPDVIFVSTSGYGFGVPFSSVRSYGMMTEIMCGITALNGYESESVRRGACPITDHPSTYHGAFVMMAALIKRRRTGKGMWIDMSQYEIGVNMLGDAFVANAIGAPIPERSAHHDPGSSFSGVFQCAGTERWVAISASNLEAWRALCALVSRDDLAAGDPFGSDSSNLRDTMSRAVATWCADRDPVAAADALSAAGIAASPVNDARDLLLDRHLEGRSYFALVDHAPEQHAGQRAFPGPSAKLSVTPGEIRHRAPLLGEHNREVATNILGYSSAEFEQLESIGAFGTTPAAAAIKPATADVPGRVNLPAAAASARTKLYDPEFMPQMKSRFGASYGEPAATVPPAK